MLEKWQIHAILWANYDLVNLAATQIRTQRSLGDGLRMSATLRENLATLREDATQWPIKDGNNFAQLCAYKYFYGYLSFALL